MRRAIAAVLIGFAAFASPSAEQMSVDEVIAKHIDALGGMDKLKAVNTVRMTGKMTVGPGIEAPVVMELKRPSMMRLDFTVQGMTGSQAYDGKVGWTLMPFQGSTTPQQMAGEELSMMAEQADIDGPLVDYKAKGNTVELLGKEAVDGADAYKLKVTLKNGVVRTMYIDAEHFLQVKEESKRTIRGSEIEGETILGDYKEVGGMMFPHSVDSGQKGNPQRQKIAVDKIEVNVPIDDTRFKMPESK
jgi:outer membrane lipoprotein-sorting protein